MFGLGFNDTFDYILVQALQKCVDLVVALRWVTQTDLDDPKLHAQSCQCKYAVDTGYFTPIYRVFVQCIVRWCFPFAQPKLITTSIKLADTSCGG